MSNRFEICPTSLPGLQVMHRQVVGDSRGYLERLFCIDALQPFMPGKSIVQINHTFTSRRGMVRGMHFQHPPHAEVKFVTCLRGEVFDVAVDLRRESDTFLQWHAERLSADNHMTMIIPEGFAHGLQTLSDDCEMLYLHTASYDPAAEGGLHPLDTRVSIQWPLTVVGLSQRDNDRPYVADDFVGISL